MSKDVNQETEALNNHVAFSQSLLADQLKCTQSSEHSLVNWLSGEPPGFQSNEQPTTLLQQQLTSVVGPMGLPAGVIPSIQQQPSTIIATGYNMRN